MEKEQKKGVLYFLYGNINMAILATKKLLEISDDEQLRKNLVSELEALEKFKSAAVQARDDVKIKELSDLATLGAEFSIDMKTMSDKSTPHLMELLAKGYKKGIESIKSNIENSDGESERVIELANGYLEFCRQKYTKYNGLNENKLN